MTDAQDTIELPVFGLTLEPRGGDDNNAWCAGSVLSTRMDVRRGFDIWYVTARIKRTHDTYSGYEAYGVTVDEAADRLLVEMTPDDVAAIRALGERS